MLRESTLRKALLYLSVLLVLTFSSSGVHAETVFKQEVDLDTLNNEGTPYLRSSLPIPANSGHRFNFSVSSYDEVALIIVVRHAAVSEGFEVEFSSSLSNATFSRTGSSTQVLYTLYASNMAELCPETNVNGTLLPCAIDMVIARSSQTLVNTVYDLYMYTAFNMKLNVPYSGNVKGNYSTFYVFEADGDDLPVLCQTIPSDSDSTLVMKLYPELHINEFIWRYSSHDIVIEGSSRFYFPGVYLLEVECDPSFADCISEDFVIFAHSNFRLISRIEFSAFGFLTALSILLTCVCFVGVLIYRRKRQQQRMLVQMWAAQQRAMEEGGQPQPNQGATEEQLDALKLVTFVPSLFNDPDDAKCSICLGDYEDGEQLRELKCLHYFHKECVDEWLVHKKHCPLCQQDIENAVNVKSPTARGSTPAEPPQDPVPLVEEADGPEYNSLRHLPSMEEIALPSLRIPLSQQRDGFSTGTPSSTSGLSLSSPHPLTLAERRERRIRSRAQNRMLRSNSPSQPASPLSLNSPDLISAPSNQSSLPAAHIGIDDNDDLEAANSLPGMSIETPPTGPSIPRRQSRTSRQDSPTMDFPHIEDL